METNLSMVTLDLRDAKSSSAYHLLCPIVTAVTISGQTTQSVTCYGVPGGKAVLFCLAIPGLSCLCKGPPYHLVRAQLEALYPGPQCHFSVVHLLVSDLDVCC